MNKLLRMFGIFFAFMALVQLQGCASMGEQQRTGTAVGMTTGAVIGAVIGNQVGNPRTGAAIGALLGTSVGNLFGSKLDEQKLAFEAELSRQRKVQAVQVAAAERAVLLTLYDRTFFKAGSAEIEGDGYETLQRIAAVLNQYPSTKVTVTGFADNTGNRQYNLALSQRRALMVAAYLLLRGVDAQRITVQGNGSNTPIASNERSAGRQLNRRVEIRINA